MSSDESEILLNEYARRSFRDTADGDYVTARFAYRADLIQQALWASQQALEKYIKGVLLYRRVIWDKPSHSLLKPLAKLEEQFPLDLSQDARKFIQYLEDANDRYLTYPFGTDGLELLKLDKTVWDLRRYCIPYGPGKTPMGKPTSELDLIHIQEARNHPPQHYRSLSRGPLEQLIQATADSPARKALVWNNRYFGKAQRKSIKMDGRSESVNSVLALHPEIIDELRKYVYLPKP
jgi:HEPN domain-containing protein